MTEKITSETWLKFGYNPPVKKPLPPAKYMPHADCFGFDDDLGCTVLKKTYCCHVVCRFYKQKKEVETC